MSRPARYPTTLDRCSLALALLLAACGGSSNRGGGGEATAVSFAPAAPGTALPSAWLAFPFPADFRRLAGGGPDLHDFPNPSNSSLLTSYVTAAATLDGFSTNGAAYFHFDGPLDSSTVPTGPARGLDADAPIQLVDVTPGSPEYAVRRPLRVTIQTQSGAYVAPNTLAVAPAWGFPLRAGTTYAVLVDSTVRAAGGGPLAAPPLLALALGTGSDTGGVDAATVARIVASFAPLRAYLAAQHLDAKRLVAATVFTTQHVAADLDALAAQIASRPAPPYRDAWQTPQGGTGSSVARRFLWHKSPDSTTDYYLLQGRFTSPNYMVGDVPYNSGGQLQLTSPYRDEDLRFVLSVPAAPPTSGACYPIVEYAHGTGSTPDAAGAYSFDTDGTAGRLAARGLAGISIDQPLHGQRAGGLTFNVELATFNFLNITSARSILRQSAVDTLSLTRFVRSSLRVPASVSPTGKDLCFDPSRVGFLGHSQGGLSGALAASESDDVPTFMLSGAGGGLAITLIERKQPVDISALMAATLAMAPGEVLDDMHPVVTVVQTLLDATDPINYASRWLTASPPHSVLLTSGLHDANTPYATATALAAAAGVPAVQPLVTTMTALDLRGLTPLVAPVTDNAGGATAGLLQWDSTPPGADDSHFVIFNRPEAIHAVLRFFESAAYGTGPTIERDPASTDQ